MSKRQLFGTDGIRGKANVYPMTCEVAFALGRAVTSYFQTKKDSKPLIIIGKDTRLSCYMLEQAFSSGVCSQGGRAILTGPLATQSMRADAGVMISASHNPYYDNGIKIFDAYGHKLPDEVELELENMVLNPSLIKVKVDDELGSAKRLDEVVARYIVHTKSTFNMKYSLEGMRLVVDAANGAAYRAAPMVFEELGAEVITNGVKPDGLNINSGVGALHPSKCSKLVQKYRADLGICIDGDGDRVVIVDSSGEIIDGDKLFGILAKFLLDTGILKDNPVVVGTVMSNFGLEHYLMKHGIKLLRTKVGDRYIMEQIRKDNLIFGGEPSGHIIFKNYATTGDGVLAALKVIECMKYYQKTFTELAAEVELFPQALINVKVDHKPEFSTVPKIIEAVESAEKELGSEGRILLRYSGTEMLARVMVEGKNLSLVNQLATKVASVVARELSKD